MDCEKRIFAFRALFISFGIAYNVQTNCTGWLSKPLRGPSREKNIRFSSYEIAIVHTLICIRILLSVLFGHSETNIAVLFLYLYDFTVIVLFSFLNKMQIWLNPVYGFIVFLGFCRLGQMSRVIGRRPITDDRLCNWFSTA